MSSKYCHSNLELNDIERQNVVEISKQNIKIYQIIPDIFKNPSTPLRLTDLSGDTFEVEGWFQTRNLMKHIHQTLPQLGKIDIYIQSVTDKPDQLGSRSYTRTS